MRAALLLCLVALEVSAQGRLYDRTCAVSSRRSSRGGVGCATAAIDGGVFAFATSTGAGMGEACACAAVTQADGGAITVSRATSEWCFKGATVTGIANGDAVLCGNNLPSIMPGGDGTGDLGIQVWEARTNLVDDDLTHVDWVKENVTVAAPVVTLNACTAPDGTLTGTRVQFAAATAAEDSAIRQDLALGSGTFSGSLYIRAYSSGSGSIDICNYAAVWDCDSVAWDDVSWNRRLQENVAGGNYFLFGNAGFRSGNAHTASDVCIWKPQFEAKPTAGPPIGDGTRNATNVSGTGYMRHGLVDLNATVVTSSTLTPSATNAAHVSMEMGASDSWVRAGVTNAAKNDCGFRLTGTTTTKLSAASEVASTANLVRCYWDATNYASCVGGVCATTDGELTLETGAATVWIGTDGAHSLNYANGVVKNVLIHSTQESRTAWISDSLSTPDNGNASGQYATAAKRVVDFYGVGGAVFISEIQTQWSTNKKSYDTRLIVEGGINDIRVDVTGLALYTAFVAFVESAQAEGVTVIAANLGPFKTGPLWSAGRQTEADDFNSRLATYCGTHPTLICVDLNLTWDADADDILDVAYDSGDHIHPNDTGGLAFANAILAAAP